jgi:hypothetical protein
MSRLFWREAFLHQEPFTRKVFMAGYFLYSLDWQRVDHFLQAPEEAQVRKMAKSISDYLDQLDDQIEDDDPEALWPSDPVELEPIVRQRLTMPDWYSGLSDSGKQMWERSWMDLCNDETLTPFDFQCESDGIYWNIMEEAMKFHSQKANVISDHVISHFGTRPFRYLHKGKITYDGWHPYHSMHTPEEVASLETAFKEAKSAILKSRHREVKDDYKELMPVLEKLATANRVLYVSVDT